MIWFSLVVAVAVAVAILVVEAVLLIVVFPVVNDLLVVVRSRVNFSSRLMFA